MCKKGGPRCDPGKPSKASYERARDTYGSSLKKDQRDALAHLVTVARAYIESGATASARTRARNELQDDIDKAAEAGDRDLLVTLVQVITESEQRAKIEEERDSAWRSWRGAEMGPGDPCWCNSKKRYSDCHGAPIPLPENALLPPEEWVAAQPRAVSMAELYRVRDKEMREVSAAVAEELFSSVNVTELVAYEMNAEISVDAAVATIVDKLKSKGTYEEGMETSLKRKLKGHVRTEVVRLDGSAEQFLSRVAKAARKDVRGSIETATKFFRLKSPDGVLAEDAARDYGTDVTRQGWYEPHARAFIQSRLTGNGKVVQGLIDLPAGGKDCIRFVERGGKVAPGAKAHTDMTKSVDFIVFEYDKTTGHLAAQLVSHKHTDDKRGGGGQKNQEKDAKAFLDSSLQSSTRGDDIPQVRTIVTEQMRATGMTIDVPPEKFTWRPALILDGDYNQDTEQTLRGSVDQRAAKRRGSSFIGSTDDFVAHMLMPPDDRVSDFTPTG